MSRSTAPDRRHAVVLGASMGGLLAARVLVEEFETVTIVERDPLPDGARPRRGVPQGRHVHVLLPGGAAVLAELFPGLLEDLTARGVPAVRALSDVRFTLGGHCLSQQPLPFGPVHLATRPLLEHLVRERVRALPGVRVLDGHDATGLVSRRDGRVDGVAVHERRPGTADVVLDADLVVVATGRGSATGRWLERLGYDRPREEQIRVGLRYVTEPVVLRDPPPEHAVIVGPLPRRPLAAFVEHVEGGRWLFTLSGYQGHHPPTTRAQRLDLARGVLPADVLDAVTASEPAGDVAVHDFPSDVRRHYEELARFPRGLLVCGDAVCAFNPIHGQGMSVAAQQAMVLRSCLRRGRHEDGDLARRFFRGASRPVGVAWSIAAGSDLALPLVPGPRPVAVRVLNRYVEWVQQTAAQDGEVARRFLQVSGLVESPASLFRPSVAGPVLAGRVRVPPPRVPLRRRPSGAARAASTGSAGSSRGPGR